MPFQNLSFARRLWPFLRPVRRQWIIGVSALVGVHVIELFVPLCLKAGINAVARGEHRLLLPVAGIAALTLARYGVLHFGRRRNAMVSTELAFGLRQAVYAHLLQQGPHFFMRYPVGDLMARITNDIDAVRMYFRSGVHRMVSAVALLIVAPLFMVFQSAELTLLVLASLAVLTGMSWYLANRVRAQAALVQSGFAGLMEKVRQNIRGIHTIQSYAQEEREIADFAGTAKDYAGVTYQQSRLNGLLNSLIVSGSTATTLIIVGLGGAQVQAGTMSIGTLTAFIFYLAMIMWVVKDTAWPAYLLMRATASGRRIFQILDEKPEIQDLGHAKRPGAVQGQIAVEDLSFRFPGGKEAIRHVQFSIAPGELVFVLGRIGSGKSTLLRLLARQFDPVSGTIRLDGQDLKDIPLAGLRRDISVVMQDSFLFAAPIGENISFDEPERGDEPIWRAADAAALGQTIRAFEDGLKTPVGERGVTLSGGQKQRTSLARGLIREVPVLLLDDCLSALDAQTEEDILQDIRRLRAQRTTIIVSHRVSSTRHADRILILDDGAIVEMGTHVALLAKGGLYASMLATQNKAMPPSQTSKEMA